MAPSPTPLDDLRVFSINEVAERLAVSKRSVERLIAQGELKTLRPSERGRTVQVPAISLREYIYGGA